jgi:hypothetical protein
MFHDGKNWIEDKYLPYLSKEIQGNKLSKIRKWTTFWALIAPWTYTTYISRHLKKAFRAKI